MKETTGRYYDTLPDGRVLIVSPIPDEVDETGVRVLWSDREEITAEQRKKIFALVKDIAVSQLEDREYTRRTLTVDFLRKNMEQLQMSAISLAIGGTCDKGTASLFIDYLINVCMEFDIPTERPLTELADDLGKYAYAALFHKRCLICGKKADIHHVDQVGMGYNRNTKPQLGALVMPLCREHHSEWHSIGGTAFGEKYHVEPVPMDKRIAQKYGISGRAES